ncbi:MAG TPA: PQQ-dependent sugar dehydrogenase [Halococcus sp.]|nr:PQQ-dependent sugar dehydrogenase [Halococcus sp.]
MTDRTDPGTTGSQTSRRRFLGTAVGGAVVGASSSVSSDRRFDSSTIELSQHSAVIPQGPTIALEPIAEGFSMPTDFAVPPGSRRKFILDRTGEVYVVGPDGLREEPFLDVSDRMAEIDGEQGLLGIAFHPDYQQNRKFYLRYSAPPRDDTPKPYSHVEVLAEFRASDDGSRGKPDSERILLEVREPQSNHNAGAVAFGPDGYCYVPFGDGGGGNDTGFGHADDWYHENEGGNGQNVSANFLGSLLRIDVDSRENDKPYGIPDDNPLVGKPGLDEQYAWGFRNPWRMGFSNGTLFVADVGQNLYEEVNIVEKGGNYGWNVREGTHCFDAENPLDSPKHCPVRTPSDVRGGEPLLDPIIEYPHTKNDQPIGSAVIGGYVSEGQVDALDGMYIFGDYSEGDGTPTGSLFAATPLKEGLWPFVELEIEGRENGELNALLLSIGRDNAGDLYVLTTNDELGGAVHKLVPARKKNTANNGNESTANTDSTQTAGSEKPSSTEGPGFGVLAALAGLAGVAYYLLSGRTR